MSDLPLIPGYRIERELGQGGAARVFLAIEEKLDRRVALKVLRPGLADDSLTTARFLKEARIAAKLSHRHILIIYDVDARAGFYFIATEYLEGGSLRERLLAPGGQDSRSALSICTDIAAALDYAHQEGFVHRDIKPENIMFRKDGTAVLADFGIAKALGSATKLTRTGYSIGTPHYMSPEQARGKELDGRSDLYALGVVLYEMLTGCVPYDAEESVAIAIMHIQEPVPTLPPALAPFQQLITATMAKDRNDRVQSAGDLIRQIRQISPSGALQAEPIPPAPTPPTYPGRPTRRSTPSTVGSPARRTRKPAIKDSAPKTRDIIVTRRRRKWIIAVCYLLLALFSFGFFFAVLTFIKGSFD